MKIKIIVVLLAIVAAACGGGKKETVPPSTTATPPTYPDAYPLPINELRADRGKTLFQSKCTTCHDLDRKVIGPPLRGVTQRRTYNWMMNMILYPDRWVKTDSVAKALHKEYNYVQMIIPGGITEDQAMAVIAYLQREDAQSMSQP